MLWSKENVSPFLVGVQTCTNTIEIIYGSSSENWKAIYLKTQIYYYSWTNNQNMTHPNTKTLAQLCSQWLSL